MACSMLIGVATLAVIALHMDASATAEHHETVVAVAPSNMNRETALLDNRRNMMLQESDAKNIAQMMVNKNISILIEFSQKFHNRGTLLAIYGGHSKVFELFSEGLKGELRAYWRREFSLANLNIQNVELDDEEWHRVIFDLHGDHMRLTIDCLDTGVSGEYPELSFSLLNRTRPSVWVTQRSATQSLLMGKLRQFKVKQGSYFNDLCAGTVLSRVNFATPLLGLLSPSTVTNGSQHSESIDELRNKVKTLETEISKWRPQAIQPQPSSSATGKLSTSEPDPSKGICPNCYEYLRFKVNHLEEEFKRWRDTVQKVETSLKRVLLFQRGCSVDATYYNDGDSWIRNCTECVCNLGKQICKPVGCKSLSCAKPLRVPGQCCPTCGAQCYYMQNMYDHGTVFWPKSCVRCECNNGETLCAFHEQSKCPQVNCPLHQQAVPENQCCPVCVNDNFCSAHPCHSNATCVNLSHGRQCKCSDGFFGDGSDHCYDIDECQANDKQKVCGDGSRCINTLGGYYCECLPGYVKLNNRTCFDSVSNTIT